MAAAGLDLVGGSAPELPGSTLARYWRAPQMAAPSLIMAELSKGINVDTMFPNSRGPMRAILDNQLHYILDGRNREELYAWRTDSVEEHNLVADTALRGELQRLRDRLDSARAGWAPVAHR